MPNTASDFRRLSDGLDRGLALPTAWYSDPAIGALERERIFRRTWQYVGRVERVARVGDFFTGLVGDIPVVVTRAAAGIRVLVNVCRHRRHEVAQGEGHRQTLQ